MKKFILSLAAILICAGAYAKDTAKVRKSPEEIAAKRSAQLKEKLELTDDQKTKVYASMLDKINRKQAIKEKYKGGTDKKSMRMEMKAVEDGFDADMKSILTAEQYTKWQGIKTKQKEKHKEKRGKGPKAKKTGP